MKQSFPKCNQSNMEFVISTNEKQQEEVRFLSGDFPVSVYTQHYRHTAFERLGDLDAMDIAMTCATVGILSGIFGGLFFIKLGTKKGLSLIHIL